MVNKVILIGNLGRDPEVRRLENGAVVAKFTIATSESYKDKSGAWQEQTEWHNIVVWRTLAERAETQLKKGMPVYIEGKLTHRSWKDQDGNDRYITEVVANYFRSLAKKESSGHFPSQTDEPGGHYNDAPPPATPMPDGGSDNDLPF